MDQRTLVERARQGDRDAFATLVRASATRLDAAARGDGSLTRDHLEHGAAALGSAAPLSFL